VNKEEVSDLREDLRLLRPVFEELTRAVNSNTNVLSELKGQLSAQFLNFQGKGRDHK
jgi:hypothetical protein